MDDLADNTPTEVRVPEYGEMVYYNGVMAGFYCHIYDVWQGRVFFSHMGKDGIVDMYLSCPIDAMKLGQPDSSCPWSVGFSSCRDEGA